MRKYPTRYYEKAQHAMSAGEALAKIVWNDARTGKTKEYILMEGATATIGRSSNNEIQVAEQHVSRQHAVIRYQDGIFMINDLGSSNGTFVNDEQIDEPFPLFAGDTIRLYVPTLEFKAVEPGDTAQAMETGQIITATKPGGQGSLSVTNGPQEGQTFVLQPDTVTIGRAIENATWEIGLLDASVSRPHARLEQRNDRWYIYDLNSSNGSTLNGEPLDNSGALLTDGDTLTLGGSILLFRSGWHASKSDDEAFDPTISER